MAATVTVRERTGTSGSPTNTDITSATSNFNLADSYTSGSSNPVQIPSGSANYSFWKSVYLNADTSPAGTIDTVQYYTDGTDSFGTGVTMTVSTASSLAYTQAVGSATSGTQVSNSSYSGSGTAVNAFTYTSAAPLSVTGSISNPSTGKVSDFWVEQIALTSSTAPGNMTTETITLTYHET